MKYEFISRMLSIIMLSILLVGCSGNDPDSGSTVSTGDDSSDFVDEQTWDSTISIAWDGATATVSGTADGVTITSDNGYVTVNSTAKHVEYALSGSGTGQLKIYSTHKVKLSLNGLTLSCSDGPAINNQCTKSCYIVLTGSNSLSDKSGYSAELTVGSSTEDQKGAFFSEGQILVSGEGSLSVTGNNKHALASDDYIRILGGTLRLTANVSDALHSNDAVIINSGSITINATDEGIQVDEGTFLMTDGTLSITTTGTKSKGVKSEGDLLISGGTIDVTTPGRESEGIESKSVLTISGGTVNVTAYDDAINSGSHMYLTGGTITAISTGNDGIDANGNLYVQGGTIMAFGTSAPECGLDANEEGGYSIYFTGGSLLAVGGGNSTPSSSASTQPYVTGSLSVSGGNTVSLVSGSNTIVSFSVPANYNSGSSSSGWGKGGGSSVLITCPNMTKGSSYTISSGSSSTSATAQQYGSSNTGGGPGNGGRW